MESRRRDKLDASCIDDLKFIPSRSSKFEEEEVPSELISSEMNRNEPVKYESISKPVPTVPTRMVLVQPKQKIKQKSIVSESSAKDKICVSFNGFNPLEKLPPKSKESKKSTEKRSKMVDDRPSLFWIEGTEPYKKSNKSAK